MVGRIDLSPFIQSASERFQVPLPLINAVVGAESSGNPAAVGPVTRYGTSARGAMQIMEPTYRELQKKHGLGDDIHDPANNIQAGTAYLRQLHDQYGNWPDAVRAYNAGPGAYDLIKAGKRSMPAETYSYSQKVLRNAGIAEGGPTPLTPPPKPAPRAVASKERPVARGLLETSEDKNWLDGLGGLLGFGQTPSQPPAVDAEMRRLGTGQYAGSGATQTPDVSSRINEILGGLAGSKPPASAMDPLQYRLAGMAGAMAPLAATTDRKVGIGEMLGALAGGNMRGKLAGVEAARGEREAQFGELANMAKLQQYQRSERQSVAATEAANRYADILESKGHSDIAAALRGNPSLMDEILKAQAASTFPKEGGGFTLAPGQSRFDAQGNPIAQVAPTQDSFTLAPGQTRYGPDGQPIANAAPTQDPYTLAPGQTRYGPDNQPLASVPKEPPKEVDPKFTMTTKLRGEFTSAAQPFIDVAKSFKRLESAYGNASKETDPTLQGPSDIALVFSYMKMLDPGSVVREGEAASVTNSGGVPERVRGLYNNLIGGGSLTTAVRDSVLREAKGQFGAAYQTHAPTIQYYQRLATENGLDPNQVVFDLLKPDPEPEGNKPKRVKVDAQGNIIQ